MYHQFDRTMHPRQSILKHILTLRETSRELEDSARDLEAKLRKLGVSDPSLDVRAPPAYSAPPPRPDSLILGAPLSCKEAQREEGEREEGREGAPACSDGERTVEGSSATEKAYGELQGSFGSKPEPSLVSLELGVARMTC
ncbi:hypothetical protein MATL_G00022180 [Megalops atlanticus]|uniref:Uncharacterized protein n=1 Tax=Megalops atlanticus TaxID=7932 RepID=A0A9D3QCA1_MEGAT|nr:hypothetical protein MATL_G00022180 [Megalops atlanticus]